MKRLFVFGCSYTSWAIPTWADILATGYDQFENWAVQGAGNRCIVERLSECIMSKNITADDTIIVQWTDFHREDYHKPGLLGNMNWSRSGSILVNPDVSSTIKESWNEFSYVMHSMNYINLGINLLKNQPCTWFVTSSIDLTQDFEKFSSLEIYKKMFEDTQWIPCLDSIIPNKTSYVGTTIKSPFGSNIDAHLTPTLHNAWLEKYILPKLDVKIYKGFLQKIEGLLGPSNILQVDNPDNLDLALLMSADWTRLRTAVQGL
jgi:hypothetical protein